MKHNISKYSTKEAKAQSAKRAASRRRQYHGGEKEYSWTIAELEAQSRKSVQNLESDGDCLFA